VSPWDTEDLSTGSGCREGFGGDLAHRKERVCVTNYSLRTYFLRTDEHHREATPRKRAYALGRSGSTEKGKDEN